MQATMQKTAKNVLNKKIAFVSLGCDKNRVDLERIIANVTNAGFKTTQNLNEANIIIVNTCSFIESARKESIEAILNAINLKSLKCEKIIVTGCINQMNYQDLTSSLPEVDLFVKVADNSNIVKCIYSLYGLNAPEQVYNCNTRILSTASHYAYLKIAEGCNNFCSYCTIPFIRGRYKSVPMEELIEEVKELVKLGVKEIILVAQDVTKYGEDLYGEIKLVELIQEISKFNEIKWIRLLYCYPELVNDKLIYEIKNNDKVVKYIDVPIQHINSNILKLMNRKSSAEKIYSVIRKLKNEIPNIAIRSTFILGFPGETENDFNEVLDFLKTEKLTNVGFFAYSREEGTRAHDFENQINTRTKNARVKKAYLTQQKVVESFNNNLVSKVFDVIIDSVENNCYVGRAYFSAPNVDSVIYIPINKNNKSKIKIGDIVKIKITNVLGYDLEGEYYESTK